MFLALPTPKEMSHWDAAALEFGLPEALLMENAARAALTELRRYYGPLAGRKIFLLAGSGNNGGDASCLARALLDCQALPSLALSKDLPPEAGAAGLFLALARKSGLPTEVLPQEPEAAAARLRELAQDCQIIVDGLLGTGFSGSLRPRELALIQAMNALPRTIFRLALDLPSGLSALEGKPQPEALRADLCVSFQAAKPGLVLPKAAPYTGLLRVSPIGMPRQVQEDQAASFRLWRPEQADPADAYSLHQNGSPLGQIDLAEQKPASNCRWSEIHGLEPANFTGNFTGSLPGAFSRSAQAQASSSAYPQEQSFFSPRQACQAGARALLAGPEHKGQSGKVLIIGGSPGLSGAPRLAALGALKSGAGLICLAAPAEVILEIRQSLPEVTTLSLPACCKPNIQAKTREPGLQAEEPDQKGQPDQTSQIDKADGANQADGALARHWPAALPQNLAQALKSYAALVLGPGMGQGKDRAEFMAALLAFPGRPRAVLDADALNTLAENPQLLSLLGAGDILTPHPGEAARLLGWSTEQVQAQRLSALKLLAGLAPAVWLLKGPGSMLAAPDRPSTIFSQQVPQLAIGGSGDVLAGICGQMLALGLPSDLAAVQAVDLHLAAGQALAKAFPWRGNSPQDIALALPQVLHRLRLLPPQQQAT